MRRDQLEHAIRAACQIIGRHEVIVVGSQAILGTFSEDELPVRATMSGEVGILPIADSNEEAVRLTDLIEGVAGGIGSSRCRTPTRPNSVAGSGSLAGASTRRISPGRARRLRRDRSAPGDGSGAIPTGS
jgi:hypothetical protein